MATEELTPGDKILVEVDSALPDILIVSYLRNGKKFQGALLDASKRGLPCGVQPPEPNKNPEEDQLASVAARFTYFQEKKFTHLPKTELKRNTHNPGKGKNIRPTVRLRPRQVLCSKCRSICNENSENVGRKRKNDEQDQSEQPTRRSDRRCNSQQQQQQQPPVNHGQNTRSQRFLNNNDQSDDSSSSKTTSSSQPDKLPSSKLSPVLIPKTPKVTPNDIGSAIQSANAVKTRIQLAQKARDAYWNGHVEEELADESEDVEIRSMNAIPQAEPVELDSNPINVYCATPRRLSSSSVESAKIPEEEEEIEKTLAAADSTVKSSGGRPGRVTRKKRSIGMMEDLWDESVFEDPTRMTTTTRTTPIIKISFGAQGEGTVLKIPSKIQNPYSEGRDVDTDTEETLIEPERDPLELPKEFDINSCPLQTDLDGQITVESLKQSPNGKDNETASTKAAKKALKKAKKKALRKMYEVASPARSPCNGSPRYAANFDKILYHKRKHKVKHKKKHKEERKHKSQQTQVLPDTSVDAPMTDSQQSLMQLDCQGEALLDSNVDDAKEQCLKQKLSISLKRLNTNAYAARCEHEYPVSNASSGCKSPGATSEDEDEAVDDNEIAAETAPDFPPSEHPLVMRLSAATTPVEHCLTGSGKRMDVGDVVWGKVHGFPWWPGKVLSITDASKEDGSSTGPQAHVAWYGSSTSSLMSCDQLSPFLETFKTRYNKKKKGPYKEAIRQAQNEARNQVTACPNSTGSVLDVCGSPREVNVLS